jgi:hypothetical protein
MKTLKYVFSQSSANQKIKNLGGERMKKRMASALAALFMVGMAGTAFAGPFADVPAKHWSYDAVNKLAAAGIVDGYSDGTFKGEKTMTRYEMAQIVGKAMERTDKADAEQKALIKKLSDEYADELGSLGVRVTALENRVGNIKLSGQVRQWYEYTDDDTLSDKTGLNTRLLLFMDAPLAKDLSFKGRLWAESPWGGLNGNGGAGTGADVSMDQAYLQGKNFTFGRQGIMLGKGLTYAWFPNNDGATYTMGDDNLKLTAAAFKSNAFAGPSLNVLAADVAYKATDNLDLSMVYVKNDNKDAAGEVINTWAAGFGYKGIKDVAITAEYGINSSEQANITNGGDDAKGWVAQVKYKGAEFDKPHTFGVWAGYRDADPGFFGRNGDYIWETPVGFAALNGGNYLMDDVKGIDYGVDYTLFKNGVATVQYFDLENSAGTQDRKGMTAQLRYMF